MTDDPNIRHAMAAHGLPENAARELIEWQAATQAFRAAYVVRGDQAAADVMAAWANRHADEILAADAAGRQRCRDAWRSN